MASPTDKSKSDKHDRDPRGPESASGRDDGGNGNGSAADDYGLAPLIDPGARRGSSGGSTRPAGEDDGEFGLGSLIDPDAAPAGDPPAGNGSPAPGPKGPAEPDPAAVEPGRTSEPPTPAPTDTGQSDAAAAGAEMDPAPAPPADDDSTPTEIAGDGDDGSAEKTDEDQPLTARELAEARAAERRAIKEAKKEEKEARKRARPQMRKLRFLALLIFLGALALVSWVFGVMMAVTSDLPDLEARAQYDKAQNSTVTDRNGSRLVTLTGNERRQLIESEDISPLMKQAVVAIEDERFYEHRGIDYMGLARALREDIMAGGAVQGGSTITQQFVKTALEAQQDRTVLQKLKEAALAYQIERQWSKDKILTNYLNNIYFGNGAYGIEAAAKTYFGANHPGCGTGNEPACASQLRIDEAAMLAGMISSPTAYDPTQHPQAAVERRNVVLEKMRSLGTLEVSDSEMADLESISAPGATTVKPPSEESEAPYFTEWLRQQIVDKYGAGQAFGGGLQVKSTLDLDLQNAAQSIISQRLTGVGPTAAAVVMENGTGKVRAMVGGLDYDTSSFNSATNGLRQPGSSFKPFTLVTALDNGISPDSTWTSAPVKIPFEAKIRKKNGKTKTVTENFAPKNYDDNYLGTASLTTATTYSDNSVYAQVGMQVGPKKIADMAENLGINSKVPHNPAMILGGLKHGVSPLDMTYAYSTLANGGNKISGTMASRGVGKGPVAIEEVTDKDGDPVEDKLGATGENKEVDDQVLDPDTAQTATDILHTVVTSGTGKNAQVGDDYIWGKTGTTDGNIDAWFCGANEEITACVWVGYAEGGVGMETEYGGSPVDGGTIPALLWHDIVSSWDDLQAGRLADKRSKKAAKAAEAAAAEAPATTTPAPAPVTPAPAPAPEAPVEEDPVTPPAEETPATPAPGTEGAVEGGAAPVG